MAPSFRELVGVPPSVASVKDSVLVIIDAQNEYATGALKTANVDATRKAIAALLERYRAGGGYVAHVVHITPPGAPVFTPNTPLADEFDELKPNTASGKEVVVEKNFPNSFAATNLEEFVKGTGLKKLVLTGYMAHVCVSTTARAGHEKGYEVIIAEDAVGDRDIPGASAAEVKKVIDLLLNHAPLGVRGLFVDCTLTSYSTPF